MTHYFYFIKYHHTLRSSVPIKRVGTSNGSKLQVHSTTRGPHISIQRRQCGALNDRTNVEMKPGLMVRLWNLQYKECLMFQPLADKYAHLCVSGIPYHMFYPSQSINSNFRRQQRFNQRTQHVAKCKLTKVV